MRSAEAETRMPKLPWWEWWWRLDGERGSGYKGNYTCWEGEIALVEVVVESEG